MARSVAIFDRGPHWDPTKSVYEQETGPDHLASMRASHERGVLLMGGPFTDQGAVAGIAVLETATPEEAEQLMARDPSVRYLDVRGVVALRKVIDPHVQVS